MPRSLSILRNDDSHINHAQAERDPDEEGDYMAFEQLMAESLKKQDKSKTKDKEKDKDKHSHMFSSMHHESKKEKGSASMADMDARYDPSSGYERWKTDPESYDPSTKVPPHRS